MNKQQLKIVDPHVVMVCRAVALAEETADGEAAEKLKRLKAYHQQGGITAEKAEEYLGEVRKNRSSWGRGW